MKVTIETLNDTVKEQFLARAEDYDIRAAKRFDSIVLLGHDMDVLDFLKEVSDWSSWEVDNNED